MSQTRIYQIPVADGATANTDLAILHGIVVTDCWVIKTVGAGGAGDTITLADGAGNNITNAMSINVADETVVRATLLDDAQSTVTAAEGLRAEMVKASGANTACIVEVLGFPTTTP